METYTTAPNSLTNVTRGGRKVVQFGLIGLVLLMTGRLLWGSFWSYWEATHPRPTPPPTMGFGQLPELRFPEITSATSYEYTLELPTGSLPVFGDRASVFFMPPASIGLFSSEDASEVASSYGFTSPPTILTSTEYRWSKTGQFLETLDVAIDTDNITYSTDYLAKPELLLQTDVLSGFNALEQTKRFLQKAELLPPDMATSSGSVVYKKSLAGELVDAVSVSDADFVAVDINRTPIDDTYSLFTPEGEVGVVHAVLTSGTSSQNGVLELSRRYHPVDYTQSHTYPLKTTDQAYQELRSGSGYIAQYTGSANAVTIRSVELGYYDDFEYQAYLQPIYVFRGDNNFLGYVPAATLSLQQ
ncbi:MAG: hypothetical protein H6774_04180 [Pseudomonadales bacterium]|nr:hypothetical protein [Pseudomonadales bacterium]